MSTILGIFKRANQPIENQWGPQMLSDSDLWPHDRENTYSSASAFLACQHQFNTPQAKLAVQPFSDSKKHLHLVFDGRIDNRQELAERVNIKLSEEITDEELILHAFMLFKENITDYLIGDFALAIYDSTRNSLFVTRDHMGVRPLFIAETEEFIAFASNKKALLSLPFVTENINEQWLADLLAVTKVDSHSTFYLDIQAFKAAHQMTVDTQTLLIKKYWELDASYELKGLSDNEYIEQFKSLLFEAVQCRLRSYNNQNASELSGGLDSTSVSSVAASILSKESNHLDTFSHQLPPENMGKVFPFKDETEWIELFNKTVKGTTHTAIYSRNLGIITALNRANKVHSGPERNDLTKMSAELFETLQNKNIRTLLSGFGGDQCVTSHAEGWIDELANNKQWLTLWRQAHLLTSSPYKSAKVSLSALLRKYKLNPFRPYKKFLKSWPDYSSRITANISFLESNGYPARYYQHPTRPYSGTVREREHVVIHSPHLVYRLEDSAVGAASYGVDYRYPLLDIRLLQFCLSLPTQQKTSDGFRRRIIRMATQNLLPDKIRLRQDKSRATIPTIRQRDIHDQQKILTFIEKTNNHRLEKYLNINAVENHYKNLTENSTSEISKKHIFRTLSLLSNINRL